MKNLSLPTFLTLIAITFLLSGCDLIVGIFEAGFWVGVIVFVIVIGLIVWLAGKFLG